MLVYSPFYVLNQDIGPLVIIVVVILGQDIVIKEIRNIVGSGHNKHRHIKWIITWEWLFLIAIKKIESFRRTLNNNMQKVDYKSISMYFSAKLTLNLRLS